MGRERGSFLSPSGHQGTFLRGDLGWFLRFLYSLKKENVTALLCRCPLRRRIFLLCFHLNQPLKKIRGTVQGCWSSRGTRGWSAIKWPLRRAICVPFAPSSPFQPEPRQSPFASLLMPWLCPPSQRLGQVRKRAHVVRQDIWAALYAHLFLSLLLPFCVFLMGISVRCAGVQSHCGLKRISDDRKYVNLLFPSGQREKVQRFNGWWR